MNAKKNTNTIIYQAPNGAIELKGDLTKETVWASQAQIAEIFGVERSVATKHIKNIFQDNEISLESNVQNLHTANSDKPVKFYSLDLILAVGYRTKSSVAIKFRQWATKTLKQHITQGYTINKKLLQKNYNTKIKKVCPFKTEHEKTYLNRDYLYKYIVLSNIKSSRKVKLCY